MIRYISLLLFLGLVWGQFDGQVELKSGVIYKGQITAVNESYVFLLADDKENPQGIPITIILKSVLNDGTKLVENGELMNVIQDNQLTTYNEPKESTNEFMQDIDSDIENNSEDCYSMGVEQAKIDYKTKGFGSGLCSGILLGAPGWLIGSLIMSMSQPEAPYELLKNLEGDCRWSFEKGYKDEAKKYRKSNFSVGAGLMTGIYILSFMFFN